MKRKDGNGKEGGGDEPRKKTDKGGGKKGKAQVGTTTSSAARASSAGAVAEYVSAAEAAAIVASSSGRGSGGGGGGGVGSKRFRRTPTKSRAPANESSDREESSSAVENVENVATADAVPLTPGPSTASSALEEKMALATRSAEARADTRKGGDRGGSAPSSALDEKRAIAERSEIRRNKSDSADAVPGGVASAGSRGPGDTAKADATYTSHAGNVEPQEAAATVALHGLCASDELRLASSPGQRALRSDEDEELGRSVSSLSPADLVSPGAGPYALEGSSGGMRSEDASKQSIGMDVSTDSHGHGGRMSSRRALVEAVLVDEDEITRRAYEKAATDIRQQMRATAVSAREVVLVPDQIKEGNEEDEDGSSPLSCWQRRRSLWIAIVALLVIAGVVIGAVVGTMKPGANSSNDTLSETIVPGLRSDGTPITFVSLSGLSDCRPSSGSRLLRRRSISRSMIEGECTASTLFAVEDSNAKRTRVLSIDTSQAPATVYAELNVTDPNGIVEAQLLKRNFSTSNIVLGDGALALDAEGIASSAYGGFWIANEGSGTAGSAEDPLMSPNFLVKISDDGVVQGTVFLPDSLNAVQADNGFEGVEEDGTRVIVGFQRPLLNETDNRIGVYDTKSKEWAFCFYTVDPVESPDGGWVGIADISRRGPGSFLVMERDSKDDDEARVKRIYKTQIDYGESLSGQILTKELVIDLLPLIQEATSDGDLVPEKFEGMGIDGFGNLWVVNDSDGNDDDTYLIKVLSNASWSS